MRSPGRLLSIILVAAAFAGCLDTSPDSSASLYITGEATGDVQEVHLTVTEAYIRAADGSTNGTTPGGDDPGERSQGPTIGFAQQEGERDEESELPRFEAEEGWVEVVQEPLGLDAAFLRDEQVTTFLGESAVGEGSFDEVGLLLEDAYAVNASGEEVDVRLTNRAPVASGNFTIPSDGETRIVLTVDVEESLTRAEDGGWRLSPTFLNVQVDHVSDDESGNQAHDPGQPADPTQG